MSDGDICPECGGGEGWQPIGTAPKDGTRILVWVRDGSRGGWYEVACWWEVPPSDGAWVSPVDDWVENTLAHITHWMPLSPPPNVDAIPPAPV